MLVTKIDLIINFDALTKSNDNLNISITISDDWVAELGSEEFKKYLNDINSACTDETFRTSLKFNEEYAGMPGTFRLLSVD